VAAWLTMHAEARLATAGRAVGVVAMLAAPGGWAASVLDTTYGGTSLNASAGPAGAMGGGTFIGVTRGIPGPVSNPAQPVEAGAGGAGAGGPVSSPVQSGAPVPPGGASPGGAGSGRYRAVLDFPGGPGGGLGGIAATATLTLSPAEQRIYDYVSAHRDGAGYLMAVESWDTAAPYIVATGQEVMPMGGFSGTVPEPTLAQVQALVRSGQLRFFLLDGTGAGGAGVAGFGLGGRGSAAATIVAWVESGACAAVPATDYQTTTGTGGGLGGPGPVGATLYECQRTA
jgi:hypothetical protein